MIDALRAAIAARTPVDDRERSSIARTLTELDRLDRPCDEHADPVHLTGSAIVIGPSGVLLHLHKRMGIWLQPGGHIDDGETPWDAALRETLEETGLVATHADGAPELVHVDVHDAPKGHVHLDLRYLLSADGEPCPREDESPEVRWFSWAEAVAVADDGLIGALQGLMARFEK